jgi:hypothetical protein
MPSFRGEVSVSITSINNFTGDSRKNIRIRNRVNKTDFIFLPIIPVR